MQLPEPGRPDFAAVYRAHYGFVWRTVRHLGVDPTRVDDAVQDAFLVVYRRLHEFAGRAAMRTWLFEIARRIASRYRRSAARELPRRGSLVEAELAATPASAPVEQVEAAAILQGFLDGLDRDQAVVFVMTELEQWQAPEIAAELGVNLNTVYARLRAARRELDRMVRRLDARDNRQRPRRGAQVLSALVVAGPPWPPPWRLAPPHDASVVSDMLLHTWSIEPVVRSTALAAAHNTAAGLSLVGLSLTTVLVFGSASEPVPSPAPRTVSGAAEPFRRTAASANAPPALAFASTHDADAVGSPAPAAVANTAASGDPAVAGPAPARPGSTSSRIAADDAAAARHASGSAGSGTEPATTLPADASVPAPEAADDASVGLHAGGDPDASALAAELALLEAIRAALLTDEDRAIVDLVARHRQRFPAGVFVQEAAAASIEARCRLGERDRARREADAFLARWPTSALAARVGALCQS